MDKFIKSVVFILLALVSSISMKAYDSESSYQPTINVNGYYLDPTANDLVYGSMSLQVKGDKIVSYKTPFTHEYVECQIPYKKMTPHEKSQMRLTDSQGRSYELYVGNSEYVATVGKLTVYFADYGFGKTKIYSMDEVVQRPYVCRPNTALEINTIEGYIKSNIKFNDGGPNTNPLGDMIVSFIINRDEKISDVQILKTPDSSLNDVVLKSIESINSDKSIRIQPAKIEVKHQNGILYVDVSCRYQITLKVRPRMTKSQKLDAYISHWDAFFSKRKEDIDYARKNYSTSRRETTIPIIPSDLKDLNLFVENFPVSEIIKSHTIHTDIHTTSDIARCDGIVDRWHKIVKKNFKYDKSHKAINSKADVSIEEGMVLKNKSNNEALAYLLDKLNDMIYFRIIESGACEKFGKNIYIPRSLNEVAGFYTKKEAAEDFKNYFERIFNTRVDQLKRDSDFNKYYLQWEELYYLSELGWRRNIILNKEKTKIVGYYFFNEAKSKRTINFINTNSYVLYPLQNGGGKYDFSGIIRLSSNPSWRGL